MTFKSGASFDGKRASSGGRGRGGMIATGGGVGSLLLIGLYLLPVSYTHLTLPTKA